MKHTPAAAGPMRRRLHRSRILAAAAIVILILAGCGAHRSSTPVPDPSSAPAGTTIVIKNFSFHPASLTVAPGTTVTVHNEDSATHTLTAVDKAFDTGNVRGGQTVTFTAPSKPGSYPYICSIHQFMHGTLTVK